MKTPLFYKQKPLFAIDIGRSTVKAVQLRGSRGKARLVGYGYADFDPSAVENGVITKPDEIINSLQPLLQQIVIGKLTTDRVVASMPTANIFIRFLELIDVAAADLQNAVELEAQQYVPLPFDNIYLDYLVLGQEEQATRILMVATPKQIVDSHMELFSRLNLEPAGLEPSLLANIRAVNHAHSVEKPKIIIDFGSESSDLAIYDGSVRLTSTSSTGGNQITKVIEDTLGVDADKAEEIKSRYGIAKSKWQDKLAPALAPILTALVDEVQKMLRYHHDRSDTDAAISDIIIVGGGANLPGLGDFLTHLTGIQVATCNPWDNITIKPLQPPHKLETTLYTTAVGLALKELER